MTKKVKRNMDFFGFKIYRICNLSNDECLFFSNIFSWSKSKKFKEAVYKSDEEMSVEINCEKRSIRYIRSKLISLGLLKIGKRETLKFNGATPYYLCFDKIKYINNKEILKEINIIKKEGVTKSVTDSDKNDNRLLPKLSPTVTKSVTDSDKIDTSYIEADYTQITQQKETPTPFSESELIFPEPEQSARVTNDFLEVKAQEFLDLTDLEDLRATERQTTIAMFKTRLQVLLRQHSKTLDDFMASARHHYVDERPNQPQYVIRPQNFIERTKDGIKQSPWLDHVGKAKPVKRQPTREEIARLAEMKEQERVREQERWDALSEKDKGRRIRAEKIMRDVRVFSQEQKEIYWKEDEAKRHELYFLRMEVGEEEDALMDFAEEYIQKLKEEKK